ncbi:MAG: CopG family ribbon-helix-helix protein [bacterium]
MTAVTSKKIMLTIPTDLLTEVETLARKNNSNRSELIRKSLRAYLDGIKMHQLREKLKEGYIVNAERDTNLSEEFRYVDNELERRLTQQEDDPN